MREALHRPTLSRQVCRNIINLAGLSTKQPWPQSARHCATLQCCVLLNAAAKGKAKAAAAKGPASAAAKAKKAAAAPAAEKGKGKAAAKAAAADSDEDAEVVAAAAGSEDEDDEEGGEEEEEEEGTQDPAAKPLAPLVLKAPTAKQKPGKVTLSPGCTVPGMPCFFLLLPAAALQLAGIDMLHVSLALKGAPPWQVSEQPLSAWSRSSTCGSFVRICSGKDVCHEGRMQRV